MWLILSLSAALFTSIQDALNKKVSGQADVYVTAWSWWAFSLPFVYPLMFFQKLPALDLSFWLMTIASTVFLVWAVVLYIKALEASDLSLSVPMLSFTPLLLLLTSSVMLKESATKEGIVGVMFIVLGSYLLFVEKSSKGFFAPFKLLFKEKGCLYMLAVAVIFSVTGNVDKIGVLRSSPFWWIIILNTGLTLGLTPVMLLKSKKIIPQIQNNWKQFLMIGACNSFSLIFQMIALPMTHVAYVISVKRISILFSTILGAVFFKEKNFKGRIFATLLMVFGVILLALFSA